MGFTKLIFMLVFDKLMFSICKLIAVTDMPSEYAQHLYHKLRNNDPPSRWDIATMNPEARQRICEEIFSSGLVAGTIMKEEEMLRDLDRPQYLDIFHQIFILSGDEVTYEYANPYDLQGVQAPLTIDRNLKFYNTTEHVFVCPVRKDSSDGIKFYYVSKEYNLHDSEPYTAGRFIFGDEDLPRHEILRLAEEPSTIGVRDENFNIELYYLQRRNYHVPGNQDHDPICRLVSKNPQINQYHRICVKVLSASYFQAQIKSIIHVRSSVCSKERIAFRTPAGFAASINKLAYKSYEVFAYFRDPPDDQIYLENLVIDVNMVEEPREEDSLEEME